MEVRNVRGCGLRMSAVGLGCNNFGWKVDDEGAARIVGGALDLGVNVFDTSDQYGAEPGGSEIALGKALGARRQDAVVITKFGVEPKGGGLNSSRGYILQAVEASLRRLRTDWIDVYMIHWPDAQTPMEETLRTLDDLVRSGKVRYLACSNLPPWRLADALWISRQQRLESFVLVEDQYNLLAREVEAQLIPALDHYGLGLLPYFPLASGLLSGKHTRTRHEADAASASPNPRTQVRGMFATERNWQTITALEAFAGDRHRSILELAMSWLVAHPAVASVISGASSPEQLEQNVRAAEWELTAADLAEIDAITKPA